MFPLTLEMIVSNRSANGHWAVIWPASFEVSFSISSTVWIYIEYFKNHVYFHRKCLDYTKYFVAKSEQYQFRKT